MAPPCPPLAVLIRRTASPAHSSGASVLTAKVRPERSASMSATRAGGGSTPALLTSRSSRPKRSSRVAKMVATDAGSARSPPTVPAWPPCTRQRSATAAAASARAP
jgi:hypothetical protein